MELNVVDTPGHADFGGEVCFSLSPYLLPELSMESSSLDIQQIRAVEKNRACVCSIDHWEVLEENLIP